MIYIALALVTVAALVFWFVLNSKRAQAPVPEEAAVEATGWQADARREPNLALWLPTLEGLPIVDPAVSPLMHTPIWDCVGGLFELPCLHSSYDRHAGQRHLGMPFGMVMRQDLRDTLAEFAGRPDGSIALIRVGDAAYLVYAHDPSAFGALVQRWMRTGEDEFMVYGWRAGMDRDGGQVDPPFRVADVARKPELWAKRLERQEKAWQGNTEYLAERHRCPHRLSMTAAA